MSPPKMLPILSVAVAVLLTVGPALGQSLPQPGDTMEDPFWLPWLPWVATGNTCDYEPNYDELCPYGGWAGDVVYAYTPEEDMLVSIWLCDSYYDTKLLVYENGWPDLLACNDDGCSGPNYPVGPWLSYLDDLSFLAGNTYYIVVAGYTSACGPYILNVTRGAECDLECPAFATLEGEPICHDGYVDHYNGGCDAQSPAFQPVELGNEPVAICGTSGIFFVDFMEVRDTDWYEIALDQLSEVTFCLAPEFPGKLHIFDALAGCEDPFQIEGASCQPCSMACVRRILPSGTYWFRISPQVGSATPCGATYLVTIARDTQPAAVGDSSPSLSTSLGSYPDPFRDVTRIHFQLSREDPVELDVFDISGRCVRTLLDGRPHPAGKHAVEWNGRDERGAELPCGIYHYRLATPTHRETRPILLVR